MSKIVDILLPRDVAEAFAGMQGGGVADLAGLVAIGAHLIESGHTRGLNISLDISDGVVVPIQVGQAPILRGVAKLTPENLDLPPLGQAALSAANNVLQHIRSQRGSPDVVTMLDVPLNNGFTVRFTSDNMPIVFRRD